MVGDQNNLNRPAQGMADRPAVRSPLDELRAEVTTLSDNPLLPAGIRSTLRRAVTVLLDQDMELRNLRSLIVDQQDQTRRAFNVLAEQSMRLQALEVARHG